MVEIMSVVFCMIGGRIKCGHSSFYFAFNSYNTKQRVILLISIKRVNSRIVYLAATVMTVLLGLASRKFSSSLPLFLAENAGDALWAMMVYFGFRFLFERKRLFISICLSFLFSFGIEFSQLYQVDWLNQIRATTIGALILGKGFLMIDLVRYTAGIIIATIMDKALSKIKR